MKNLRAVFWDIDGTMVMSEPVHDAKMVYIAGKHGLTLAEEIVAQFHGSGDRLAFSLMQSAGLPGSYEDFLAACDDFYRSQLHTIDVREGFAEIFAMIEAQGIPQCAVSNGVASLVEMNIDRAGVREKLKAVIDLDYIHDNGFSPKPAADPYLEALRQVNEGQEKSIRPDQCLVIEDSPTGIAAGKTAGMTTIYWKLAPEKIAPEGADFEAYTGAELRAIIQTFLPRILAA